MQNPYRTRQIPVVASVVPSRAYESCMINLNSVNLSTSLCKWSALLDWIPALHMDQPITEPSGMQS